MFLRVIKWFFFIIYNCVWFWFTVSTRLWRFICCVVVAPCDERKRINRPVSFLSDFLRAGVVFWVGVVEMPAYRCFGRFCCAPERRPRPDKRIFVSPIEEPSRHGVLLFIICWLGSGNRSSFLRINKLHRRTGAFRALALFRGVLPVALFWNVLCGKPGILRVHFEMTFPGIAAKIMACYILLRHSFYFNSFVSIKKRLMLCFTTSSHNLKYFA